MLLRGLTHSRQGLRPRRRNTGKVHIAGRKSRRGLLRDELVMTAPCIRHFQCTRIREGGYVRDCYSVFVSCHHGGAGDSRTKGAAANAKCYDAQCEPKHRHPRRESVRAFIHEYGAAQRRIPSCAPGATVLLR